MDTTSLDALVTGEHRDEPGQVAALEQGADVNLYKKDDDTPLINAAQQGNLDVVELLLAEGADPNGEGDYDRRLEVQRTPLNQAEKSGHADVAARLRAAGANG